LKKINYKKLLIALLWILVIAGLSISLGFVSKTGKHVIAKKLEIRIHNDEENVFLRERDVKNFFAERNDPVLNQPFHQLSIPALEKALNAHPAVENAEIFADMNGIVKVEVVQRTPVVRIINKDGESYYVDSQTKLMPLNENYSARTLVATGEIYEPYSRRYQFTVNQIKRNQKFSEVSVLDDIMDVATYINSDSVLLNLIHQVNVNKDGELELFPVIGGHKIVFGSADAIGEKFNKLKLFYTQGLNKSDSWNKYSTINLKYKNLVVCTKK
jgi:cell division protein FtsQ